MAAPVPGMPESEDGQSAWPLIVLVSVMVVGAALLALRKKPTA